MEINKFKADLQVEIKNAMLNKDKLTLNTLRSISTAIINAEKSNNISINIIDIISTLAKQRQQSIDGFIAGGNNELAEMEKQELYILNQYLPQKMNSNEIENIINDLLNNDFKDITIKEQGKLIKFFKDKYPGQDISLVSSIIKQKLS